MRPILAVLAALIALPLLRWAEDQGIELPDLEVRKPSLEDVFLEVTADSEEEER